jgi:hypothetical protein
MNDDAVHADVGAALYEFVEGAPAAGDGEFS